ncbi:MAG: SH3 domain-containing protein, partial [Chloroflexota bacterium]
MEISSRLTLFVLIMGLFTQLAKAQVRLEFEALLYDEVNGRIIKVDNFGTEIFNQPMTALMNETFSLFASVSPDGRYVAYTTSGITGTRLHIYDTITQLDQITYDIPLSSGFAYTSLDFMGTSEMWTSDSAYFALGVQDGQTGRITVFNISDVSGTPAFQIDSTNPQLSSALDSFGSFGYLPIPRWFRSLTDMHFTPILTGTEGLPEYPNIRWNLTDNTFSEADRFRTLSTDFFPETNETIEGIRDYSLPNMSDLIIGPGAQFNTIQIGIGLDPSTVIWRVDAERSFYRANFVQGGERIAIFSEHLPSGIRQWNLYERNSTFVATLAMGDIITSGFMGTTEGFLYTSNTAQIAPVISDPLPVDTSALMYITTTGPADPSTVIWTGGPNVYPKLVWVDDFLDDLVPPDINSWQSPSNPDDDPELPLASPPTLAIGNSARITTTDGDRSNMRSGAGTNFDIVARLNDGDIVTLLEGPIDDGTFTWWRVRTVDGQEGWVVQSADNVQVLVPTSNTTNPPVRATDTSSSSTEITIGAEVIVTQAGDNLNMRAHIEIITRLCDDDLSP